MKVFARGHIQSQNDSPYFEELILHTKVSCFCSQRGPTQDVVLCTAVSFLYQPKSQAGGEGIFVLAEYNTNPCMVF